MIIHNVAQGSEQWERLRAGIPTASEFHKILTPGGKLSKQAEGYMHHLLAEHLTGHPIIGIQTEWMERGHVLEEQAVLAYEFHTDLSTSTVGFITTDDGMVGASPDRLVGDRRLLEIKCPKHNTHVGYMLTGKVEDDYLPQLQGQLWISERDCVDIVAFHPEMGHVIIPVQRNEEYIKSLADAVGSFVEVMLTKREELETRYGKLRRPVILPALGDGSGLGFDLSEGDVTRIWEASASQSLMPQ